MMCFKCCSRMKDFRGAQCFSKRYPYRMRYEAADFGGFVRYEPARRLAGGGRSPPLQQGLPQLSADAAPAALPALLLLCL
jgi:hypothetical protein